MNNQWIAREEGSVLCADSCGRGWILVTAKGKTSTVTKRHSFLFVHAALLFFHHHHHAPVPASHHPACYHDEDCLFVAARLNLWFFRQHLLYHCFREDEHNDGNSSTRRQEEATITFVLIGVNFLLLVGLSLSYWLQFSLQYPYRSFESEGKIFLLKAIEPFLVDSNG